MDKLEFKTAYDAVFDGNGNIKPCGRNVCRNLIITASRFGRDNYGDRESGVMRVDAIKQLYQELFAN